MPPVLQSVPNPDAIVDADFDLDGRRDLAVANGPPNNDISILMATMPFTVVTTQAEGQI